MAHERKRKQMYNEKAAMEELVKVPFIHSKHLLFYLLSGLRKILLYRWQRPPHILYIHILSSVEGKLSFI